ncbi:MAG TPA: hypothetical protein VGJ09_20345 [Bryobacteraceae bacterium]
MGVAKSLKRLVILGLLTCAAAWAQDTVAVKVGLSIPGPIFLVDGQAYTSAQVFQWTVGSNHQVYFLQTAEPDGSLGTHQYQVTPGYRYSFGSWTLVGQAAPSSQGPLISVSVSPTLTDVLGDVQEQIALYIYFSGFTDGSIACSSVPVPNDPREGVVIAGSGCFGAASTAWVSPGPVNLAAAPFPGFIFTNWLINGNVVNTASFEYNVVIPASITPIFIKAKRARFRSSPLGLSLLVDHQLVKPGPLLNGPYSGDPYCPIDYSLLSVNFPVGYVPLCVGDFDYLPGTQHVLGAPDPQIDAQGMPWIFSGFSNGLGQGGIYTANSDTNTVDTVSAFFVRGVLTQVLTVPAGLKVTVDGQDDATGSNRIWGEGQSHHLVAAATQMDATGHPWKFVSWSNGGTADQTYVVPSGVPLLTLAATYAPAGKLQIDSVPSGLPFVVDGAACNTPCILLDKATGAQVQIVAPATVSPDASRRYDFKSWSSGTTSNTFQVTIGDQAQVFSATYQASYKLSTSSLPANQVSFSTAPSSADNFFVDGTQVAITATPNNGFRFKQWSGDVSGSSLTASLLMAGPRSAVAVMDGFPFVSTVKNAAADTPTGTVGPGSDITILGINLAGASDVPTAGQLAQTIDDVWVTLNDRLLALLFVSPLQINAQLFSDLQDGDYTLTVHRTAQPDAAKTFTVRRDSPGLFQWYPAQGSPTVAAFREDGSMLTAANPASLNETISIYGTGFGLYDRTLVDGFPTPDSGNWNVVDAVKVAIGTQTYTPLTARAANGLAGMVVIRVKLTGTLPSGLNDIKVTINNTDSNTSKLPIK